MKHIIQFQASNFNLLSEKYPSQLRGREIASYDTILEIIHTAFFVWQHRP